ncbi:AraC family transcriptional regulator [Spirochaeta isovalerica]|uniref:AraC-like DNA-binding protein n=1 Tax=Spirochaeta isovalerica TaxID=150 RepID=A0A841R4P3_9SPIO|nr:AraC family transcriptional regulator [Spirochaeta isovalerica]MBB6478763.1 AraC-like DNA-binding protein [Spirochaeta isovalerica]
MSIGNFSFSMITELERKLPFYLVGAGIDFHQELDPHMRPDGYPHFQWIQVKSGKGVFNVDGELHTVETNQGILLFPDVPHNYYAEESPWIVDWFTFNGSNVEKVLNLVHIDKTAVFSVFQNSLFTGIIQKSLKMVRSTEPDKGLRASLLVYEFLVSFSHYAHKIGSEGDIRLYSRLNPVLNHIEEHYSRSLTIEDLADVIGVTPQYLCLLFKKIIKQRPIEYLNNVRINKSKDLLLKNPRTKIDDISIMSGYESTSYFCSIFKKIEGMSPGRFRELHLHKKYLIS